MKLSRVNDTVSSVITGCIRKSLNRLCDRIQTQCCCIILKWDGMQSEGAERCRRNKIRSQKVYVSRDTSKKCVVSGLDLWPREAKSWIICCQHQVTQVTPLYANEMTPDEGFYFKSDWSCHIKKPKQMLCDLWVTFSSLHTAGGQRSRHTFDENLWNKDTNLQTNRGEHLTSCCQ